ncbi:MAG: hypothetical protein OQK82_02585 [Candidatus Pacearchaeota archaeon]|nr:hypothetical protein [Candidatus Pacearchaeota archaeon]
MNPITAKTVKKFSKSFSKRIGFTIVTKGSLMWALGFIQRKVQKRYANLIGKMADSLRPMAVWKFVFLPFKIGCSKVDPIKQLCVLVHEATHVLRIREWKRDGGTVASWYKMYYTNATYRASEEAVCKAAEALVMRALGRKFDVPDLRSGYVLGKSDQAHAVEVFKKHLSTDGISFESSRVAVDVLKSLGVISR